MSLLLGGVLPIRVLGMSLLLRASLLLAAVCLASETGLNPKPPKSFFPEMQWRGSDLDTRKADISAALASTTPLHSGASSFVTLRRRKSSGRQRCWQWGRPPKQVKENFLLKNTGPLHRACAAPQPQLCTSGGLPHCQQLGLPQNVSTTPLRYGASSFTTLRHGLVLSPVLHAQRSRWGALPM